MNFVEFLFDKDIPVDKVFLHHGKNASTYGQVIEGANVVACALRGLGLKKGERIILLEDSSFFWVAAYLGTIAAGMVIVPLPTTMEPGKVLSIVSSCSPSAAFVGRRYHEKFSGLLKGIPVISSDGSEVGVKLEKSPPNNGQCPPALEVDDQKDLAALMYTSGSTGEPRGVMVTHRNLIANTESIVEYLSLDSRDRIMAVLPFYYCFGTSLLHTHLKAGGSVVVENSFLFPEKVLNRMEETECTGLAGVPSTYQILLRNSTFRKRKFPALRYFQQAGGKLPANFIEDLLEIFPDKELFVMYGQTEATARLSYLPPEHLESRMGSIGKGIPGVELEVLSQDGHQVAPGEVGEIVAKGENITAGYWNAPEETAKSFKNGRLYTGDLATIDDEGFIYVVDREKEFIKCGGHRVSSKEIEAILVKMDGIIEAAVVPMPDDKLGEAVCAFVTHVKGNAALEEIGKFSVKNIKWPFGPKKILCLKHMPKNSSGKIDKILLKKMVREET